MPRYRETGDSLSHESTVAWVLFLSGNFKLKRAEHRKPGYNFKLQAYTKPTLPCAQLAKMKQRRNKGKVSTVHAATGVHITVFPAQATSNAQFI